MTNLTTTTENLFPQEQEQAPKKVRRGRRRRVAFIWPAELAQRINTLHERTGVDTQRLTERALSIGLDTVEKQLEQWIGGNDERHC
jgi:hypothetical protein